MKGRIKVDIEVTTNDANKCCLNCVYYDYDSFINSGWCSRDLDLDIKLPRIFYCKGYENWKISDEEFEEDNQKSKPSGITVWHNPNVETEEE